VTPSTVQDKFASPPFPDAKIKMVTAFPDKPGEWQVVDSFEDFTVQVVTRFPDFTIQVVDAFPGCGG